MPDPEPVLTLRELESWSFAGTALAVIGHPIKHSISPGMHNAALATLARTAARFADWRYFRFEVPPDDLPRALQLLKEKKFRGINLTVPHKVIAFGLVDQVDEAATPAGAVNTLLWSGEGWLGYNTDGYGLATAIRESLGRSLAGTPVILLGAGGAARGAAVECLQQGCASLFILNRTQKHLETLLAVLKPLAGKIPLLGFVSDDRRALAAAPAGGLVINATSAGLRETDAAPVDLAALTRPAAVLDMIYNPPRTALLRQAESLGLPGANGLTMLVHQGAKSLEIWSGVPAVQTAPTMLAAARAALGGTR
jgi:shikimate dehydrogenase